MINYQDKTCGSNDQEMFPIVQWEVMFLTPVGIADNLDGAIKVCKELDLDPNLCVKPIVMVTNEKGYYEAAC